MTTTKTTTLKEIKSLVRNGLATDITKSNEFQLYRLKNQHPKTVYTSSGTYGINGALLKIDDKLYAITARTPALFVMI